jgi:alkylated DNA nucleotide flippase Atl1
MLLEEEGVEFSLDGRVDLKTFRWKNNSRGTAKSK